MFNMVFNRTTHSSAHRHEEMAQEELNKQLVGNLLPPVQAIPHSLEGLTDEEIRGAGSGTDINSRALSVETDWVIPDLRNTRLSDKNLIPLDQGVTAHQHNSDKIVLVLVSLKPYFKVTCFQINVEMGQSTCTHSQRWMWASAGKWKSLIWTS